VIPANIRYSQMLSCLLNPKDEHEYIWADSEYPGEYSKDLLSSISFKSLILEKGTRNNPHNEAAKELNRVKTTIRPCVEHIFGCMTISIGGKLTRKIGFARAAAWWGLKNLTFNLLRYLQHTSGLAAIALHRKKSSQSACRSKPSIVRDCLTCLLFSGFWMPFDICQKLDFLRCP
jgi:hypothetical protein